MLGVRDGTSGHFSLDLDGFRTYYFGECHMLWSFGTFYGGQRSWSDRYGYCTPFWTNPGVNMRAQCTIMSNHGDPLKLDESNLVDVVQKSLLNFMGLVTSGSFHQSQDFATCTSTIWLSSNKNGPNFLILGV